MTEDIANRVASFLPTGPANEIWDDDGPDIMKIVNDYDPDSVKQASDFLTMLANFTADIRTLGYLDPVADLLRPELIARHIESIQNLRTRRTRRTRRNGLRRLGRATNPSLAWPLETEPLPGSETPRPYTASEVTRHLQAARSHPRPIVKHTYLWCLVAGVGLGAETRTIQTITPNDIEHVEIGITVRLPGRTMPVPAQGIWASQLLELARNTAPDEPILGNPDRIGNNIRFSGSAPNDRLHLGRCRSTWIVAQLNAGLPLHVLLGAAGLNTPRALDSYLGFADLDHSTSAGLLSAACQHLPLVRGA